MKNTAASMFIGVNAGYNTDVGVADPQTAKNLVSKQLTLLQRSGANDHNDYQVYPGVVIYRSEWGCPEGGEPVAA